MVAFPTRRYERARQAGTILLLALLLAGGLCPALYAGQVPHAHLFVGGPPPPNWEHHDHDNPLIILLGAPPGPVTRPDEVSAPGARGSAVNSSSAPVTTGRVVSLYAGSPILVISIIDFATLHVLVGAMGAVEFARRLRPLEITPPAEPNRRPPSPPPRSPKLPFLLASI